MPKPKFPLDEDLGSADTPYRNVYVQNIVPGGNGSVPTSKILSGVASYKVASGRLTTVTAADTVVTGLSTVTSVQATMDSDPVDDPFMCSATIGDQAGTPAAGSVIIKTWQNTTGLDPTPTAATTFSKKVGWLAFGT